MKKYFCCFIIFGFSITSLFGADFALSFGPWSFLTEDERIGEGVYPYAGLSMGWGESLESELFVVIEAAPDPLNSLFIGGGVGGPLLGDRSTTYFNAYAQLDFLYGIRFTETDIEHNRIIGGRLSPLVIGNSFNGYRDRIFTVGLFYNFDSKDISFTWNFMIFDVFL